MIIEIKHNMKEFWNNRYKENVYAYGKKPNVFFKEIITTYPPGKLLLPAEGEGRNAVFAAKLGWEVYCFDNSVEAINKAQKLSKENNVEITYYEGDLVHLDQLNFEPEFFDAIGLIYVHLPPELRHQTHQKLSCLLKKGGTVILEAFNKNQIGNPSGGPNNIELLYDTKVIEMDFKDEFRTKILTETTLNLEEGIYHLGKADVIRYVGEKLV